MKIFNFDSFFSLFTILFFKNSYFWAFFVGFSLKDNLGLWTIFGRSCLMCAVRTERAKIGNVQIFVFRWIDAHPSPHTGQSVDPMPWSSLIGRMLPCLMMVNDPWLQILHSSWPKLIDYDRISHQVWLRWSRHMEESSRLSSCFEFPPPTPIFISDDLILFIFPPSLFLLVVL